MKLFKVEKSDDPKKKLQALFLLDNGRLKIVRFGATGYSDYIQSHDRQKKKDYIARHGAREDFNNPLTPAACSRWLLWNKPTLQASIRDFKNRFNI